MTSHTTTPPPHVDPPVAKAIADLRAHLQQHPDARTTSVALDGMVRHLIDDVLASWKAGLSDLTFTISHLEDLAALVPDKPEPLIELSKICVDHGNHQAGLRYADSGLALNPESPELLMNRGLCLLEAGQNDAAIASFKHYLELDPENPWAYNNLGDAYRTIRLYDQAENYLKLAIHKDRSFGPAYFNLAMLYLDQADWPRCLHFGLIALKHNPHNKDAHLAVADAFMGLDEPQSAIQHALIATLIDRKFLEAYETLAAAYLELGMHDLAIAAAKEALRLNPDSWRVLGTIGKCRAKQGDFAGATLPMLETLRREPDEEGQYSLCWELGWTYFQSGDYALALEYADRAIRMKEFPDLGLSFTKGLILLAQGKLHEAEELYDCTLARARALESFDAIHEAAREASSLVSEKHIHLGDDSPILKLVRSKPRTE